MHIACKPPKMASETQRVSQIFVSKMNTFRMYIKIMHITFVPNTVIITIRNILYFNKLSSKLVHISCKPPKMGSELQRVSQIFVSKMNTFRMYIKIMHIIFLPNTIFLTISNLYNLNNLCIKSRQIN